jgi:hypothetical protein
LGLIPIQHFDGLPDRELEDAGEMPEPLLPVTSPQEQLSQFEFVVGVVGGDGDSAPQRQFGRPP